MTIRLLENVSPVLEEIASKEYLGRVPIIGRTESGSHDVLAYFPTGRSPGSRARFLAEQKDGSIKIDPSNDAQPGQGNPALIYYEAITLLSDGSLVVTNGAQTNLVAATAIQAENTKENLSPFELLQRAFSIPYMMKNFKVDAAGKKTNEMIDLTSFEPDAPNYTPRTSAVLGLERAAMSIVLKKGCGYEKRFFDIPLINGVARALPTYTGQNVPSGEVIPSYDGVPFSIPVIGETAKDYAEVLWNSLGPKQGADVVSPGQDFRVGVVAIFRDRKTHTLDYHVINKNQPKM